MAVKKVDNKNVELENTNVEVLPPVEDVEATLEAPVVEEVAFGAEVEVPEVKVDTVPAVEFDTASANVNVNNKPNGNVKIRMRVDHKCCIAMERYDLKAGKTYVVPENVKNILNKAGYLAPL